MNYKITRQYTGDKPVLFAQCNELDTAKEFILIKTTYDQSMNIKIIYRVFHDDELVYEFNKWNIKNPGELIPSFKQYRYKVIQFINVQNNIELAEFDNVLDAKQFIEGKLAKDATLHHEVIYQLYDNNQFHSEYNQSTISQSGSRSEKQQTQSFRPTPLSMTPTLGPRSFLINKDEDENSEDDNKK